ncbi:VOC family protein [Paenisporosarcina indica]|uniref:VOC family protein n=1 Tax=Paenisporosarcina indica TaxID=650093 RepID=UPI00094FB022|nr:VOC family protein [Paenisporosarcina indica]
MTFHQHPTVHPQQVNLNVRDLNQSLAFYKNIIGLQVLSQSNSTVVFTVNGKTPILTIEQPEVMEKRQPRATGLYHMAFLVPTRKDLGVIYTYLQGIGVPVGSSDHAVSEALYLNDVDGNGIEIYYDRSPLTWNWQNGEVEMTVDPLNFPRLLNDTEGLTWNGLPSGTVMGHVHLSVANLEEANTFYVKGLGFDVVCRYGGQALFISSNGYHHHIALNTWGQPQPVNRTVNTLGLKSFSLIYPSEEARQKVVLQLREIGATVIERSDYVATIDPSGTELQLLIG